MNGQTRAEDPSRSNAQGSPATGLRFELGLTALFGVCLALPFWYFKLVVPAERCCSDAYQYFYPVYAWTYGLLAEGTFPLWNPHQLTGIPTLATLQGGLLYPPHILYALLPTHTALAASGVLHMTLAGGTVLAFCRRAGLGSAPAVLAAMLVGISGSQPGFVFNPAMQEASAWLGTFLIGALWLANGRFAAGAALTAFATAMSLLAGFPQHTVYAAYASAGVLLVLLACGRATPRSATAAIGGLCLGVGIGAAMAGIQLVPALELVGQGARTRGLLPFESMFVFGAEHYADAGSAFRYVIESRLRQPALPLGFSALALVLCVVGLVDRKHDRRGLAIAGAGLACVSVLFAMGPATPLFHLYLALPELGSFRQPLRIFALADVGVALGAAVGLDAILRRLAARMRAQSGASGAQGEGGAGAPPVRGVAVAALALAATELFAAAPRLPWRMPYTQDDAFVRAFAAPRPALAALAGRPGRIWDWGQSGSETLPLKAASLFGLDSIADYEIMTLRRHAEYWNYLVYARLDAVKVTQEGLAPGMFYGRVQPFARRSVRTDALERVRLAELAAARWILATPDTLERESVAAFVAADGRRRTTLADPHFTIYENQSALPRAYLAYAAEPAPPAEALLERMSRQDFDPRKSSFVEADERATADLTQMAGTPSPHDRAEIVRADLHEVVIEVSSETQALLVLADAYYPGWKAEIDGKPAKIHATNHLFRGVRVPPGQHQVEFHYAPNSVTQGAALSIAGLTAFAWLITRARKQATAQPEP